MNKSGVWINFASGAPVVLLSWKKCLKPTIILKNLYFEIR